MKKNKIFLYERFDNIKNLKIIKKKYRTYKITEINKFKNDLVEVLFIKLGVLLNKKELSKYVNLKFIISPTTGLNHIDQDYCKENKIKIIYLDSHTKKKIKNIISTAELTITLVLLSAKKINSYLKDVENLNWNRYKHEIFQFKNYKVGIIGYGRIGKTVGRFLKALGFNILIYEKTKKSCKLNDLLKNSDIITLHINSKNNINFLNKKKLNLCKKNVSIINTSRGEVIAEADLIKFLKLNKTSSAYLDVIDEEQKNINNLKNNKLFKYQKRNNNLYLTPHIGGASKDALAFTENLAMKEFLKKKYD